MTERNQVQLREQESCGCRRDGGGGDRVRKRGRKGREEEIENSFDVLVDSACCLERRKV